MNKRLVRFGGLVTLALVLAACPPDDQETGTLDPTTAGQDLTDEARAQVDSGNAAFRAQEYEEALRHFTRVTELHPENATGWFGVYMVHDAQGNKEAADSAIARARGVAPGASLIRDTLEEGP